MTRQATTMKKLKELKILGTDGNAFSVLAIFQKQAQNENWTEEEIKTVLDEAMSGDYDHLLLTLMKHTDNLLPDKRLIP